MVDITDDMPSAAQQIENSEPQEEEEEEEEGEGEDDGVDYEITDTSAAEARKGKDIQGIPWDLLKVSREEHMQTNTEDNLNQENAPQSSKDLEKEHKLTNKDELYYEFWYNTRSIKPVIQAFQTRNLVCSTSKHDVYILFHCSVAHWSSINSKKTQVLRVSGQVVPNEKHPGCLLEGFSEVTGSSIAVRDNILIVGGLEGELICKHLDRPGVCFCTRMTDNDINNTNSIHIFDSYSGAVHFTTSSDDNAVREFDTERFQLVNQFSFPNCVLQTSTSPDGKVMIIVGDQSDGVLVDSLTGIATAHVRGHEDYITSCAWHPNGNTFATGSQDKTCRVWDARNLSKSVAVLPGNTTFIQAVRFTSDGRFMAMAEEDDFVHVFDVNNCYGTEQEIDFFGEVCGISFSPAAESLFIGVSHKHYGGLLQFNRRTGSAYLDDFT